MVDPSISSVRSRLHHQFSRGATTIRDRDVASRIGRRARRVRAEFKPHR